MFGSSRENLPTLLMLLILKSTEILGGCLDKRTCRSIYENKTWCCSYDRVCGKSYSQCNSQLDLLPVIIIFAIIFSIGCSVVCLICCLRVLKHQRLRNNFGNSNVRNITNSPQRAGHHDPGHIAYLQAAYHTDADPSVQIYPSMYEAPPPSYEVATKNLPTVKAATADQPSV